MGNAPATVITSGTLVTTAVTNIITCASPLSSANTMAFTGGAPVYPNVIIHGEINWTPGTGSTSATMTCIDDQGNTVGVSRTITVAAGNVRSDSALFLDTSGRLAHSYTIRLAQVGATANGTVNEAVAFALSAD